MPERGSTGDLRDMNRQPQGQHAVAVEHELLLQGGVTGIKRAARLDRAGDLGKREVRLALRRYDPSVSDRQPVRFRLQGWFAPRATSLARNACAAPATALATEDCTPAGECAATKRQQIGVPEPHRDVVEPDTQRLRAYLGACRRLALTLGDVRPDRTMTCPEPSIATRADS